MLLPPLHWFFLGGGVNNLFSRFTYSQGREILFLNVLKTRTVSIDDLGDEIWDVGGDEI